jgi:hypothetical protein
VVRQGATSREDVAGAILALALAAPASAGPINGTTTLLDPPLSGTTVRVEATLTSDVPVVPYEYAIQNECKLADHGGATIQHDDIVYWTDQGPGGVPEVTMPIYLQSIPAGADCKVFLIRNNTVVKGSTTSYTVG